MMQRETGAFSLKGGKSRKAIETAFRIERLSLYNHTV